MRCREWTNATRAVCQCLRAGGEVHAQQMPLATPVPCADRPLQQFNSGRGHARVASLSFTQRGWGRHLAVLRNHVLHSLFDGHAPPLLRLWSRRHEPLREARDRRYWMRRGFHRKEAHSLPAASQLRHLLGERALQFEGDVRGTDGHRDRPPRDRARARGSQVYDCKGLVSSVRKGWHCTAHDQQLRRCARESEPGGSPAGDPAPHDVSDPERCHRPKGPCSKLVRPLRVPLIFTGEAAHSLRLPGRPSCVRKNPTL